MTAADKRDVFVIRFSDRWVVSWRGKTLAQFGEETVEDPLWLACRWAAHVARKHGMGAWLIDLGRVHQVRDA